VPKVVDSKIVDRMAASVLDSARAPRLTVVRAEASRGNERGQDFGQDFARTVGAQDAWEAG